MSASIGQLIPPLRPYAIALVNLAARAGLSPRVTSTRRSHAEQARLYRRFLAGQQPYPVAPPGTSAHEFGYAFDMIIAGMRPIDFADLGQVWQGWGGVWGGQFNDQIHFEYPGFTHVRAGALPQEEKPTNIAVAADLVLSFAPGLGEAELAAELLHLGFRNSEVFKFLASPVEYTVTHYKTDPGIFAHLLRWVFGS